MQYTVDKVAMLVEKRRRAVDREYREECERVEQSVDIEIMLGSMMNDIIISNDDDLDQED